MPDLPTITVTQSQADRILAAFQEQFGTTTQAETVTAYKAWLQNRLRRAVIDHETAKFEEGQETALQEHVDAVEAELPPEVPYTDTP